MKWAIPKKSDSAIIFLPSRAVPLQRRPDDYAFADFNSPIPEQDEKDKDFAPEAECETEQRR